MKNLINKVLVVLTVSAIFAGNIDAVRTNKKPSDAAQKRREKAAEDKTEIEKIAELQALDRMKGHGESPINKKYPHVLRLEDYESCEKLAADRKDITEKDLENLRAFIVGTDAGNSKEARSPYKKSALAVIEKLTTKEVTDQKEVTKKAVDIAKDDPTPGNVQDAQEQVGTFTKMLGYLPTARQTALYGFLGLCVATLTSLGADYSKGVHLGAGIEAFVGKGVVMAKATPGAIAATPGAIWNGTKWVASTIWNAPTSVKVGAMSAYQSLKALAGYGETPSPSMEEQLPESPSWDIPEQR